MYDEGHEECKRFCVVPGREMDVKDMGEHSAGARGRVILSPDTPAKVHGDFVLEREGRVQDLGRVIPRIGLTCTV